MTDFAATVFHGPGDIHMSSRGAYLISLVHFACIYGENPEGKEFPGHNTDIDKLGKLG